MLRKRGFEKVKILRVESIDNELSKIHFVDLIEGKQHVATVEWKEGNHILGEFV